MADPHDAYIERGAAGLDFVLAGTNLRGFLAGMTASDPEKRMAILRPLAEAVLESSGALDAVARLEDLDR
jgi:hypothetical protein